MTGITERKIVPPLKDTAVRQATLGPGKKLRKIPDGDGTSKYGTGLYLLLTPTGKYWRYDYRYAGKRKTLALGTYPAVSLKQAREAHAEAKRLLAEGVDPMLEKKARKAEGMQTFRVVAERWREHWKVGKTEKHDRDVWRRLEIDVFPAIGDAPVGQLGVTAIRNCVKDIEQRGALDMARRQLQKIGQIMRYAVAYDLAERNPVADISPSDILPTRKKRNYSRIDAKDLPKLLQDIDGYVGGEHTRLAMKLMALTFVRTTELIAARWPEIDLEAARWNIPAERMKMRTPHIVPLSRQALDVLRQLQEISFNNEYVFPADTGRKGHMSNNTILFALYRMGYRGRMTGHGFRGVASTILHEHGWPHEHIELQLAHQERDEVSAAYNHARYIPQRAKMMQWWADYLDAQRAGKIVELRRA